MNANAIILALIIPCSTDPWFSGLGSLPGQFVHSRASGISADGSTVVGQSWSYSGWQAFRWQGGSMIGLGDLPSSSFESRAQAVSLDGTVVVGVGRTEDGFRGFRWESGTMQELPLLHDFGDSRANAISADGTVVAGVSSFQAFREQDGVITGLGFLNNAPYQSVATGISAGGNVIVGSSQAMDHWEAFRWENGIMTGLGSLAGPGHGSEAYAVSADGNVVVGISVSTSPGGNLAFRWKDGFMISVGDLPQGGNSSYAFAVSADGSVIVGQSSSGIGNEAFIWDEDHGMRTIRSVLVSEFGMDLGRWYLGDAVGVSADGLTIVGNVINLRGEFEGWIAHIPEPSTLAYLMLVSAILFYRAGTMNRLRRHAEKQISQRKMKAIDPVAATT